MPRRGDKFKCFVVPAACRYEPHQTPSALQYELYLHSLPLRSERILCMAKLCIVTLFTNSHHLAQFANELEELLATWKRCSISPYYMTEQSRPRAVLI